MRPLPQDPEKILIRSTNWIGDAVMTTPAVRTIREHFPDSEISLLVLPWVSDVFRHSPRVDRLISYDRQGRHQGVGGTVRLGRELGRERFDCAILLQNAFEAAFLARVARIPVRAGYTTDGRSLLLSHRVRKRPDIHTRHQVFYYQEMVAGLGMSPGANALELFIPAEISRQAREKLEQLSGGVFADRPLVGLNPGAAYGPAKRWPAEKYAALAARIVTELDGQVVVFGTAADNEAARQIQQAVDHPERVIDVTAKTDLIEAMAMIELCQAFVTNDSGLMHVAAALKVPLVAIFGSTDHIATGPFSQRSSVIRRPLACSPCKQPVCPEQHLQCLRLIGVDEVFAATATFLP
ncbi:lipopolysaccharide heptosyltransferase II [Desulfogranum mediterraneum]|uniref:lipopolysaccharide heptosyltransferase II n=1 Tax=Desulfogranum mediterraneum TaxID=160661 RepID=UPI0003F52925|nr:lipopolysaccharide heptosyltransferase II [Desulfogranum mediterraneum]